MNGSIALCARLVFALGIALMAASSHAASSRLLGAGGVTQIEGSAGGGLVPWALIAGLGSAEEIGGSAFHTNVTLDDFSLQSSGVALGGFDRVELSYAYLRFDLRDVVPGESIRMDTIGAKVRVAGDAIFAANPWLPQIAVGAQYKKNRDFDSVPKALGALDDSSIDFYLAATKIWLAGIGGRTTLANLTLRATEANQFGLAGFGAATGRYTLQPELSLGVFVADYFIVGAEHRGKPNALAAMEDNATDLFAAWLFSKHIALTAAYTDLGAIAGQKNQRGLYLSLQLSY